MSNILIGEEVNKGTNAATEDSFVPLMIGAKNDLVVQSNYLIENKPKMSKNALKLFLLLVSAIGKDDNDFNNITIRVTDILGVWPLDRGNAYTIVKNALKELSTTEFSIEQIRPDGRREIVGTTYISQYKYVQGDGQAYVKISDLFKPYLLQLKENFTKYQLHSIMIMNSTAAIRTFELVMRFTNIGMRRMTVADYKKALHIEDKYKGNNANLKKNILDRAVKEIVKETEILLDYKINGRGENAVITFKIYKKDNVMDEKRKPKDFATEEKNMLFELLKVEAGMGDHFNDRQIRRAIDKVTDDIDDKTKILKRYPLIASAYDEYIDMTLSKEIENPWLYFKKILLAKYSDMLSQQDDIRPIMIEKNKKLDYDI